MPRDFLSQSGALACPPNGPEIPPGPSAARTCLEARGLDVQISGRQVLSKIDLALRPGELVGLLGPNGAGKTTLVKALAGLIPAGGEVCLEGRALRYVEPSERARHIAYLEQGATAGWPVTVAELVALGRTPRRPVLGPLGVEDRAAAERAMARAGVEELAERRVTDLSGGERARVLIARALAVEAPILLVDEPVAQLDPFHQLRIMEILRAEAEAGTAVLAVLHDLTLALRFLDRLALLDRGRLVAVADADATGSAGLLQQVYGVEVVFGRHEGEGYAVPWRRL